MPPMVGGIRFEHTHRLIAGTVGLLTLVLAVWMQRSAFPRAVKQWSWAALLAVVAQAVLGGLTVIFLLPTPISILHACLAQAFFCLTVGLAMATAPAWQTAQPMVDPQARILRQWSVALVVAVFCQLILGAALRHSDHSPVAFHIAGAAVILILAAQLRQWAVAVGLLIMLQIFLGLGAFIFTRRLPPQTTPRGGEVFFATAHQAVGALILALAVSLALATHRYLALPASSPGRSSVWTQLAANWELTKPRLTLLAVATALVGFYLGSTGPVDLGQLFLTVLGAYAVGGGANTLNQYMERDSDARMQRTAGRPIPSGRVSPAAARNFGMGLAVAGLALLATQVHILAAMIGLIILASYLCLYTPLKRVTSLSTLVGAVPGALPPVLGWAAARHALTLETWILFTILFLWQLPHFLAIALAYREDYQRGGFQSLAATDSGWRMAGQITFYCLALLIASLFPVLVGMSGRSYLFAAVGLGLLFWMASLMMAPARNAAHARGFILASVLYLPILLMFMMLDKV